MKIEDVVIDETVEKRDRNRTIEIDCTDLSGDFLLKCRREIILTKDGIRVSTGGANGECDYVVVRRLSEIAAASITLPDSGPTLTGAQIALAVEMLSDLYAGIAPETPDVPVEPPADPEVPPEEPPADPPDNPPAGP
jgi:hypothetical protein